MRATSGVRASALLLRTSRPGASVALLSTRATAAAAQAVAPGPNGASSKPPGRVVVVTSGKGGVGKTTVTASLGYGLASRGFRTCLIDFDIGLRNLDLHLVRALVSLRERTHEPTDRPPRCLPSSLTHMLSLSCYCHPSNT